MTSGIYGNMFDIEAVKDITIFGFELRVGYQIDVFHPEVYVKRGTYVGSENAPNAWKCVLCDVEVPVIKDDTSDGSKVLIKLQIALERDVFIHAGEVVGFYITLTEPAQMWLVLLYFFIFIRYEAILVMFIYYIILFSLLPI